MTSLVVVESPAKAKTIKKYLGKDFDVIASYGHVRDLVPKEGAVDVNNDFAMQYQSIERNAKHLAEIAKRVKKADALYLAPDPDREGEAIAWHIREVLEAKKLLKDKPVYRVAFNQITKSAVQEAISSPRNISMDLVDAQQARRALDFLVGFTLSPLLWKKVRASLSAGRVQSPALRLICEREAEIAAFEAKEYWTVKADLDQFNARLTHYDSTKLEQFSLTNETETQAAVDIIKVAAKGKLTVSKVTKKERKRYPAPPFITSTLQQEASRKLGFSARRTMQVAQQLYEGVDVGDGAVGLITYMRTDSVSLAQEAIDEIRECIVTHFGDTNLPEKPNTYKTKSKNAQEAHEAIRPTSVLRHPDVIKNRLTPEQFKLYQLVWKRTMACQMIPATLDTVAVDLNATAKHIFRANGSTIRIPGFISVYQEGVDDAKKDSNDDKLLPPLEEGQCLIVKDILGEQHFTEPPPRYTEASLVKTLEAYGIGRPSTYASIISTLKQREYVEMTGKRFKASDVGMVVSRFLTNYFTQYVDYEFTAHLEDTLDDISRGEKTWVPVLREFWSPFKQTIDHVGETVQRSDVTQEKMDEACPQCNKPLSIRLGRRGRFIGCTAYPDCDYTRSLNPDDEKEKEALAGQKCPECEHDLLIRHGKYGKFIGCSNYPTCKHIEPIEKPKNTDVTCPKCNKGKILQRRSRRGKVFYSCDRYPDCEYALWNEPMAEACPQCAWPILTLKTTKRAGTQKVCPQQECDYVADVE